MWAKGFGLLLLVVGVYMVFHHRRSRRLLEASRYWPSVQGEVLESNVKRRGGSNPVYEARIKYRYEVTLLALPVESPRPRGASALVPRIQRSRYLP